MDGETREFDEFNPRGGGHDRKRETDQREQPFQLEENALAPIR